MEIIKSLKNTLKKLKNMKNYEIVITLLIIAIIISIYISTLSKPTPSTFDDPFGAKNNIYQVNQSEEAGDTLEKKLKRILSVIKGAGEVEVMITYNSSKELVPAMNTIYSDTITEEQDSSGGERKISQNETNNQPVTMNSSDGSKPLILKEVEPEIRGVIVICEGANDLQVRLELLRAVKTVLGIYANQVEVFPMDKKIIEE